MALFAGCLGRVLVLDRSILPASSASYLLHHTCHTEAVGESRLGTTSVRPSQDLQGGGRDSCPPQSSGQGD